MRLTRYTDFSLRVLIHLALHDERLCSIGEISRAYGISHNHLMKVANALAHEGFVETIRGRSGGMRLARPPQDISVGEVVRRTEEGFQLAECSGCSLAPACGLTGVLAKGVQAMLAVFDTYSIADLLTDKAAMRRLMAQQSPLGIGLS
ncbi:MULTISPECIES: Rrf2 family transcriptional regulator [Sphingobium]|jgi:Rrf2 family nitric oxide-sensitive transcriptional repressor|uniref:Rrf2 family transcriptional regulator n=1 Tax=Sphingobium baderi TaxID=1332080 RepID=A0A0S3EYU3_9SPHN|nr:MULTISPECIES: Rrf2 family transcriptional regulator [Sphingobium]ALR20612.1 Rrf2 family transcriptional regulator [Sphingobium baderi]